MIKKKIGKLLHAVQNAIRNEIDGRAQAICCVYFAAKFSLYIRQQFICQDHSISHSLSNQHILKIKWQKMLGFFPLYTDSGRNVLPLLSSSLLPSSSPRPLILSFFFPSPSCRSHGEAENERGTEQGEKSLFFRRGQHSQACTIPLPINRVCAHTHTCTHTSSSITVVTAETQLPYLYVANKYSWYDMIHTERRPIISSALPIITVIH